MFDSLISLDSLAGPPRRRSIQKFLSHLTDLLCIRVYMSKLTKV